MSRECRQSMHSMPFQEAIGLAIEIATAMRYIHSRNVLHLDLKPANTGLLSGGAVKILDFGTAVKGRSTRDGLLVAPNPTPRKSSGTAGYCSPEQFRGNMPFVASESAILIRALLVD
jgi:serine/threonine protein kinase